MASVQELASSVETKCASVIELHRKLRIIATKNEGRHEAALDALRQAVEIVAANREELETRSKALVDLRVTLQCKETDLKAANKAIADLELRVEKLVAEVAQSERTIDNLVEEVKTTHETMRRLNAQVAEQAKSAVIGSNTLMRLQAELDAAGDRERDHEQRARDETERHLSVEAQLRQTISHLNRDMDELRRLSDAVTRAKDEMVAAFEAERRMSADLRRTLTRARNDLEEAKKEERQAAPSRKETPIAAEDDFSMDFHANGTTAKRGGRARGAKTATRGRGGPRAKAASRAVDPPIDWDRMCRIPRQASPGLRHRRRRKRPQW
eukprot:Opistho-2@70683